MPKFSIIVPVYNIEKYIRVCVDSILAQSFSDFELILVDDGSPDNCPQICDEYAKNDPRVKVIHKKNGGPSAARNAGINFATGDYCWFVDGDDCVSKIALEKLSAYSDYDADIIKILPVDCYVDKEADFTKIPTENETAKIFQQKEICKIMNQACTKTLLPYAWRYIYKKSFLVKNQISFQKNLSYGEDSIFNTHAILTANKIIFTDLYVYGYRIRNDSLSTKKENEFNLERIKNIDLYDSLRDELYEKYCTYPDNAYYEDAGKHTIKTLYVYAMLHRLYASSSRNNYFLFKKISKLNMIKKAFTRFDLNKIKTKSLEWYMFWFVKHKLYLPAFLIYRFFIF